MNFYLSHMSVPSVLMIRYHRYLNHERSNRSLVYVFDGDDHPAAGLVQIHDLDLLKIVEVSSGSDADSERIFERVRRSFSFVLSTPRYIHLLGV